MSNDIRDTNTDDPNDAPNRGTLTRELIQSFQAGKFPLKLVTGRQNTSGINFDLKPGAIVAHPNSTVLFICG